MAQQSEGPTPLPEPVPSAVLFQDPRVEDEQDCGVVAFYYPGREEAWDTLCGAGFLGNFWHLGAGALVLEAPREPGRKVAFANAEAAFQALKFWPQAEDFSGLSGNGAFRLKRSLAGREDFTYGGYGSNWLGMLAVLKAKFRRGSPLAHALMRTGDSYLLEHNSVSGRDKIWSNNRDGEGTNWLGMQLMLLRDALRGKRHWTDLIGSLVDFQTGKPLGPEEADAWQETVRGATQALKETLARPAGGSAAALRDAAAPGQDAGQLPELPNAAASSSQEPLDVSPSGDPAPAGGPPRGEADEEQPDVDGEDRTQDVVALLGPRIPGLAEGDLPDLPDLPEIKDLNLVTTKLRAPLARKFTFLGGKDEKESPVLLTFVADKRRPPPEEPEPVEEEEEEEEEEVIPEPVELDPVDMTSAELWAKIVRDEGESMRPFEFGAMGWLKAWDTCADGYSVHEMMDLMRWLEVKLAPPEPKVPSWRRLLFEFSRLSRRARIKVSVGILVFLLVLAILFSAFTGWAINVTKVVSARPDGLLTVGGAEGPRMPAGVGAAVQMHGLLDCSSLRTEDLRRMEDVAFRHQGDFHLYRVAAVTQVLGGGVRIAAEDGTLVRVRGQDVTIARPWSKEEVVAPSDVAGAGTGATFRALTSVPSQRAA